MSQMNIIVSGASGNLGSAIIDFFLSRGDKVIGLVHRHHNIPLSNANYTQLVVNLMDEVSSSDCVAQCIATLGRIDAVIMTAGGFAMGNIGNTTTDQLEQQYRLNFLTAWHLTAPILDVMKQQGGGKLFFVGSSQGLDTHKGKNVVAYSLSKSLLFQLANIINADNMHSHVEAFVIVPSTIDTPQNRRDMPDADFSKWEKPATIAAIVGKYLEQKETSKKFIVIQDELKS